MIDWVDRFNKFLRVRDLFLSFYKNTDLDYEVALEDLNHEEFLYESFTWERSPEGYDFWAKINKEWLESIEEEE